MSTGLLETSKEFK